MKSQPTKEQKRESNRRWAIVKEQLYPLLLEECKSVNEMKHRLECAMKAIQDTMTLKVEAFKHQLEEDTLASWAVKPLAGKGEKTENKILQILAGESVKVVDQILTHTPRLLDSFIYEEMGERKPETLKVTWPK